MSPNPDSDCHRVNIPNGTPCSDTIQPCLVQNANRATRANVDGIGRPSKYFDFPASSLGMSATVALKRARRANPQHIKPVRINVSKYVLSPTSNARIAGATPKEIYWHVPKTLASIGRVTGRTVGMKDILGQQDYRVLDQAN